MNLCIDCRDLSIDPAERVCNGPRVALAVCRSFQSLLRGQWMHPWEGCRAWRPIEVPSLPAATGQTAG
jgi:hypothetical protein